MIQPSQEFSPGRFRISVVFLIIALVLPALLMAQNRHHPPYNCGYYVKNFKKLESDYYLSDSMVGCKSHETIASIGAGNGQRELTISTFVDSINWYLEDIDSSCLDGENFNHIRDYFQQLKKSPISGTFRIVIGQEKKTGLPQATFDRVILLNVYHELKYPDAILTEIHGILKPGGILVIQGIVAKEKGQLHPQCGMPLI